MLRSMALFSIATLLPLPFLAAGMVWGGYWVLAAWVLIALVTAGLDQLSLGVEPRAEADAEAEFPAELWLLVLLGLVQFPLLAGGVWALGLPGHLGFVESIGLLTALGLYLGQVGNSAAHELIHRRSRWLIRLGRLNFIAVLFGHHTSAHRYVHHVHVATPNDPNTARLGEGFYRYFPRAWVGSFQEGYRAETKRFGQTGRALWKHPYLHYVAGSFALIALVGWTLSWQGVVAYLALALFIQSQLLLSDYVQHYGLERRRQGDDRYEPVGDAHSWNAPHWYSGAMMLNAPRHSDHHANPAKAYGALQMPDGAGVPMLPNALPVMATIALIPPLWRKRMDHRVAAVRRAAAA